MNCLSRVWKSAKSGQLLFVVKDHMRHKKQRVGLEHLETLDLANNRIDHINQVQQLCFYCLIRYCTSLCVSTWVHLFNWPLLSYTSKCRIAKSWQIHTFLSRVLYFWVEFFTLFSVSGSLDCGYWTCLPTTSPTCPSPSPTTWRS